MDVSRLLLEVVFLLGACAVLGALFEKGRQSAILGYLLAGVLLGPNALHVVQSGENVLTVAELGIDLLLFAIGLEFSWPRLRGMGRIALGSGLLQVVGTTGIGAAVALASGLGVGAALTVGAICALSSTASVMRVLNVRGELESVHGERSLGILLVQDVAVVPLVLLVSVLAGGGTTGEIVGAVVRTVGIGVVLIGVLWVVFNHVVPRFLASGAVHQNRELALLVAVVSGTGSALGAHAVGVSPALGAFVAGLVLAGSPFAVQVQAEVASLKTLLLALFFSAVGMLSDPGWIAQHALLVGVVVAGVVVLKAGIVAGALASFRVRPRTSLATGVCLAQIGEFSFVLADIGRDRLLDAQTFSLVVSTAVLTMFLTPFLVTHAPRIAARLARHRAPIPHDEASAEGEGPDLAILVGFGPAGRAAAERLAARGMRIVVVDQNPLAARDARALGYGAVTGDAQYAEVLEHAGLRHAKLFVVMVPGVETALHLVRAARLNVPDARVFVRARFHRALPDLVAAGAHVVVDEEHEVGRRIAAAFEEEA